ncbi:MAG TPA: PhzF family phenazine biosynthesis protein [Methylomirabilota bacterium]|nr:PhzF family phenazine biosynthesis protein [Methylomirabilota bacterium]
MSTPREYRFIQVDVFTDRVFGGNPLAVVLDAKGLADGEMQAIATEMNLSETTFLLAPTRPECALRVRIFTPRRELPFAGHPTIGTAWVMATQGLVPGGASAFSLEEGIGPVPVTLEGDAKNPSFIWMRHGEPDFGPEMKNRAEIAGALGVTEGDLIAGAPIQTGSTGSRFMFVPLRDQATVDRTLLDVPRIITALGDQPLVGIFVFAPDPDPGARRVHSRMFAPHTSGIPEDPATGSATGPLGAYLVKERLIKAGDGPVQILSDQGVKMGRPSRLHIRGVVRDGRLTEIEVGGGVVPVIDGRLRVP